MSSCFLGCRTEWFVWFIETWQGQYLFVILGMGAIARQPRSFLFFVLFSHLLFPHSLSLQVREGSAFGLLHPDVSRTVVFPACPEAHTQRELPNTGKGHQFGVCAQGRDNLEESQGWRAASQGNSFRSLGWNGRCVFSTIVILRGIVFPCLLPTAAGTSAHLPSLPSRQNPCAGCYACRRGEEPPYS